MELSEREKQRRDGQRESPERSRRPDLMDTVVLPLPSDPPPRDDDAKYIVSSPQPPPEFRPLALRRKDAARALSISFSHLDTLIAQSHLRAKKSGKCLLVMVDSIDAYLASLPDVKLALPKQRRKAG